MKCMLIAFALWASSFAGAAEVTLACIGPDSEDCPMALNLNADMESLVATFNGPRKPDGSVERVSLAWTSLYFTPFGGGTILQWGPSTSAIALYGKSRPLNGELTKRQMAQAAIVFETIRYQASCRLDDQTPRCAATPLFPTQPDKVAISCMGGSDHGDCPVAVDVRLDNERLSTIFQVPSANGTRQQMVLEWCGNSTANGQPAGWVPFGQHRCVLSGTYRVLGGELTQRQLAQAFIGFTTRKVEASCALDHSNAAEGRPVCAP